MRRAAQSAGRLLFEWDIETGLVSVLARPSPPDPTAELESGVAVRAWLRRVRRADRRALVAAWRGHLAGEPFQVECAVRMTDGSTRRLECRGAVVRTAAGRPARFGGALADVTAERRRGRRLERLASLAHNSVDAMILTDCAGRIRAWNPGAAALLGSPEDGVRRRNIAELMSYPDASALREILAGVEEGHPVCAMEVTVRRSGGGAAPVSMTLSPVRGRDGSVRAVAWTGRDSSQARRIEDELRRANAALSELSAAVLRTQDETRRQIARELHDSTAQNLAALAMSLTLLGEECPAASRQHKALEECLHLAEESCREVRSLSYLLHPPLLDELGLLPALRMYVHGFARRTRIHTRLRTPGDWPRLAEAVEMNLFRIVQEALGNIHRHSGSRTARISLARAAGHVVLEIRDRGRGFPAGLLDGSASADACLGVGILGMQERARQMGGSLEIASSKGGTIVRATVPLEGRP